MAIIYTKLISFQFREVYVKLATYLAKKLPFRNEILPTLDFLRMPALVDSKQITSLAEKVPIVIPLSDLDRLETEIRLFNLRDRNQQNLNVKDPGASWQKLGENNRFPLLSRLGQACCTMFHGNADAERLIGKSHDIDDDEKRNCLSGKTVFNMFAFNYVSDFLTFQILRVRTY